MFTETHGQWFARFPNIASPTFTKNTIYAMYCLMWVLFWSHSHNQTPKDVHSFEDCLYVVAISYEFELFRNAPHIQHRTPTGFASSLRRPFPWT